MFVPSGEKSNARPRDTSVAGNGGSVAPGCTAMSLTAEPSPIESLDPLGITTLTLPVIASRVSRATPLESVLPVTSIPVIRTCMLAAGGG